jgi:antitoxin ParD1/3/4
MATIRKAITLTDEQAAWVRSQMGDRDYADESAYFADLIDRDRDEAGRLDRLKEAIQDGLESGVSDLTLSEIWETAERDSPPDNG